MSSWRYFLTPVLASACTFGLAPLETDDAALGGSAGASVGGTAGTPAGGGTASGGAASGGTAPGGAGGSVPSGGAGGSAGDASLGGSSGTGGGGGGVEGPLVGDFALDYYFITSEDDFTGVKDTGLYDSTCVLIATVSASFASSLSKMGTGKLTTGAVLAYDGPCACPTSPCYVVADAQHPWGFGVQSKALVPFRSIAVDKNEIAYGKHLYVPGFDGVYVPGTPPWGGFVHDGCVSADDAAAVVPGKDLTWFVAQKAHYQALDAKIVLTSVLVYEGGTRCP